MNNSYLYMHIWLVEKLYGYDVFCEKLIFPYSKGIHFYLTTKFVENIEKVNPLSIPIKR